jgi:hypothetical protein
MNTTDRRGMYVMWFDDSVKRTPAEKVAQAVAAYQAHFHATPNVALVNEA